VGLRIPGHGTAPVGLTDVRWEDMAAAVRLAARHLAERVGDAPLFVVGYSNGGALAVEYALASLRDPGLPRLEAIVLFSPEIGISPAAALAVWQERIGRLLGLEKLAWSSIGLEYDPFKYQSFAINAARQAHRLTGEIARRITEAAGSGDGLAGFPRVLVLQSAVDATVSTPAVIQGLLARLPARGNELVLFDLNRRTAIPELLRHDPAGMLTALLRDPTPFTLRVVTNESATSLQVVERLRLEGTDVTSRRRLGLSWPRDVFSLSHVALPFPPTDPLYGDERAEPSPGIRLGRVALRGERGVLRVPAADMLRARSNPFFPYVGERILALLDLAAGERRA